jgi:hypothetical protein
MSRRASAIAAKAVRALKVTAVDVQRADNIRLVRRQGWDKPKVRKGAVIEAYYRPRGEKYVIRLSWNTLGGTVLLSAVDAYERMVGKAKTMKTVPTVKWAVAFYEKPGNITREV